MPQSSRKSRYHQLQLDLRFELWGEVERRGETEEAFRIFAKNFFSNCPYTRKDPFWEAIVRENIF